MRQGRDPGLTDVGLLGVEHLQAQLHDKEFAII
jgi:hypothetical protein